MLQDQAAPIKTDKAVLTKVASKVLTKANLPSFYIDTTNLPNTQEDYLALSACLSPLYGETVTMTNITVLSILLWLGLH